MFQLCYNALDGVFRPGHSYDGVLGLEKKWFIVYWDIDGAKFDGPFDAKDDAVNRAVEWADTDGGATGVFSLEVETVSDEVDEEEEEDDEE